MDLGTINTSISIILAIASPIITLLGISFILGGYKERFLRLEEKIKNVAQKDEIKNFASNGEVGSIGNKLSNLSTDLARLSDRLVRYIERVDFIEMEVAHIGGFLVSKGYQEKYSKANSPIRLNEAGLELLKLSEADKYVDDHLDDLVEDIESEEPQSAYDIQQMTDDVIRDRKNTKEFIKFKDYAYYNGIALDEIIYVMGLYLRDKAMEALGFDIDRPIS